MIVRIGLPGNSYHTYEHYATKKECYDWAEKQLRGEGLAFPRDARYSLLTDKQARKCRYRDGSRCYVWD